MRVAFTTLGCKINQYETDAMRQKMVSQGNTVVPFEADADVYVINTCTVTAKSDQNCRYFIRSAARRGKGARVVVTGCYAETSPEEILTIPGVEMVIGNSNKLSIPEYLSAADPLSVRSMQPAKDLLVQAFREKTRGFLKIQDGCNNHCSYCIVPSARGKSRSAPSAKIMEEFERMVTAGCPEVVLSGIHIGTYGADLEPHTSLAELISRLVYKRGTTRLRLSSIEPRELTSGIIELLGNGLCCHLHIPLQSGDNSILCAMKRDYSAEFYHELLSSISKQVPDIALGADVIVGFPGEGDEQFKNTLRFIEQSPLTHLHVFSYSPRPGTPAASMGGQVSESVKKMRNGMLRVLGEEKNHAFRKRFINTEIKVVVEAKTHASKGMLTGLTDNYVRVFIENIDDSLIGREIPVMITKAENKSTISRTLQRL
jgi:threonylcarbamoyladenosine tRNA methylthiotransferase MtaB